MRTGSSRVESGRVESSSRVAKEMQENECPTSYICMAYRMYFVPYVSRTVCIPYRMYFVCTLDEQGSCHQSSIDTIARLVFGGQAKHERGPVNIKVLVPPTHK